MCAEPSRADNGGADCAASDRYGTGFAAAGVSMGVARGKLTASGNDAAGAWCPPTARLARERTCAEVDGVLGELTRLRVQIGLATLADAGTQVELRLGELAARTAALAEIAALDVV